MEVLGVLLVPIAIAYLIAPIASFFMAIGNRRTIAELFQRVSELDRKIAELGRAQPAAPAAAQAAPAPPPVPEQVAPSITPEPVAAAPAPPPPRTNEQILASISSETVSSPPPPPDTTVPGESIEQRFGTRWVVWIGGVALALGGIFMVRYAVEQGYFGPGMRIFMASLLAAALIAAGEWTRRNEIVSGLAGMPTAYIPGVLTAAGTTIAYATVYAAFALYGFIGAGAAFVLLGIVAIATLAAALLHGPALAALGLVGAELSPLLIAAETPNYWALYLYLAIVTAAAFALARFRMWSWLAVTAIAFGAFWAVVGVNDPHGGALEAHTFHVVAGFALVVAFIVPDLLFGPPSSGNRIDPMSSGALSAYVLLAALLVASYHHDGLVLVAFAILAVATVAIAWRIEVTAAAVPASALLATLVIVSYVVQREVTHLVAPGGMIAGTVQEPQIGNVSLHLILGAAFALFYGGSGFLAQGRSNNAQISICWSVASVFTPIAILIALYYRISGFERSIPFAGLALLLAALFAYAVEALGKRTPRPGSAAGEAIYATGAIAALALALTLALERGWLTIALALMVPGIAWIEQQRRLRALRVLAGLIVAVVIVRIGYEPRIVGRDIGTTPIFNWLLYGYGGPALSFWVAGHLMRKRADDLPLRIVEAGAILFTVLLVTLEIRHYVNGNIYAASTVLTETALQVCAGFAMTIGLEHIRLRTGSIVHNAGAIIVAAITFFLVVVFLCFLQNPLWGGIPVGPPFFNLVLLGYGIPAVLAVILALRAKDTRPMQYRVFAAGVAVGLSILYLTLEIARLFQGPVMNIDRTTDAQSYTYSAVWLVYGVALLFAGFLLQSKPARIASAAVVTLTILKVFLLDMAGLTGIWRALSFIGLGLVLIGIGYLYQRLLFQPKIQTPASPPASA